MVNRLYDFYFGNFNLWGNPTFRRKTKQASLLSNEEHSVDSC